VTVSDERAAGPDRPTAHITPPSGWLSDPNGLVLVGATYHVYYQAYPNKSDWGPMHWGHATSSDLVTWHHQPIALYPDADGMIFSGSCVVDRNDLLGFGPQTLVAFFTRHHEGEETQCIAVSTDGGFTWSRPRRDPVLRSPNNRRDFRDPVVFEWVGESGEPEDTWWVMMLTAGPGVEFYRSRTMIEWELLSRFAEPGADAPTLETPSLVRLADDEGRHHWVLTVGWMEGGPETATAMKYIVGEFDGRSFTPGVGSRFRPVDCGPDFYAAQSFRLAPQPLWMAWMANWRWARRGRRTSWRGVLSLARTLGLLSVDGQPLLTQWPVGGSAGAAPSTVGSERASVDAFGSTELPVALGAIFVDVGVVSGAVGAVVVETSTGECATLEWDDRELTLRVTATRWLDGAASRPMTTESLSRLARPIVGPCRLVIDVCTVELFLDNGLAVASLAFEPGSHFTSAHVRGAIASW